MERTDYLPHLWNGSLGILQQEWLLRVVPAINRQIKMNYQALLRMTLPFMVLSAVVGAAAYGGPGWVLLASVLTFGILPLAYIASLFALPFIVRARHKRAPELAQIPWSQVAIAITINVFVAAIMIAAVRVRMIDEFHLAWGV